MTVNRQIVLARRPQGMVDLDCFEAVQSEVPEPADGQALLQVLYVAIDPGIRSWIDKRGAGYLPAVGIGEPVRAAGIGRVIASRSETHPVGALVTCLTGWQQYALAGSDMSDLPRFGSPLPDGVDPIKYIESKGGHAMPTCPKCLEKRNRQSESEAERKQYEAWVRPYVSPETEKRRAELEAEYQEAYQALQKKRRGE